MQIQINKFNLDATDVVDILQLIIDGDFTDIGQIAQDSNTTQELPGITSNLLFKRTNASVTVLFSTGISLTVSANNVSICPLTPVFIIHCILFCMPKSLW